MLWKGLGCRSSPHRGPSKPRRSVTSPPSSSQTPLVGTLHPFHSEALFHAPVLTVDQAESCNRPPLQHTARGITIKVLPLCKRFKPCVKSRWGLHACTHMRMRTRRLIHPLLLKNTHTMGQSYLKFKVPGFYCLFFLPCMPSSIRNHDLVLTCLRKYTFVFVRLINHTDVSYSIDNRPRHQILIRKQRD